MGSERKRHVNLSTILVRVKTFASSLLRAMEYVKWWVSSFWAAFVLLGIWAGITLFYAWAVILIVHFLLGMWK